MRGLKTQMAGDVELHFLTKIQYRGILKHNPYISKVHAIEKSTNEVIQDLLTENFDYIVDLHKNLRSKRVIKKLKRIAFTFDKLNVKKWMLTRFKINRLPDVHIVDRYFEAVRVLDVKNDKKGLQFFIPESDRVPLSQLPESHRSGYVGFAIGAQHATKRLPVHKIIEICKKIDRPVVLLGGKEDRETAESIVHGSGAHVFNACGQFNLNQSASLVQQSQFLITHDTGLMHIGVALGVKIVSIWGSTVPAFGMYPYYPNNPEKYKIIENNALSCRPCSKLGYGQCPRKHFQCMESVDVDSVIDAY